LTIFSSFSRAASKVCPVRRGRSWRTRRSSPGRFGEAAHPLGIDDPDFDAGLTHRFGPVSLVAAGSFHSCLADLVLAHPAAMLAGPLRCSGRSAGETTIESTHPPCPRPHQYRRQHLILCHHPLPSLLGSGSARATVRVVGRHRICPSLPDGLLGPLSTNGRRSSDGRVVSTARSHILADFADKRARSKP
jgi:hypothetical protein